MYILLDAIIYFLTTWEKRSFQSERHMETSYVLTAASEAEANWKMLLKNCHISPSVSCMQVQMKATKLANAKTMRIGA